jgi:hypothetical protein
MKVIFIIVMVLAILLTMGCSGTRQIIQNGNTEIEETEIWYKKIFWGFFEDTIERKRQLGNKIWLEPFVIFARNPTEMEPVMGKMTGILYFWRDFIFKKERSHPDISGNTYEMLVIYWDTHTKEGEEIKIKEPIRCHDEGFLTYYYIIIGWGHDHVVDVKKITYNFKTKDMKVYVERIYDLGRQLPGDPQPITIYCVQEKYYPTKVEFILQNGKKWNVDIKLPPSIPEKK